MHTASINYVNITILTNQTRQVNTHLPQISQLLQKLVLSFNTNLLALGVKYTHVHIWSKKSPITTASQQHKHANQISSLNTHTHTIDVSVTHTQSGVTPGCRAGTIHAHTHTFFASMCTSLAMISSRASISEAITSARLALSLDIFRVSASSVDQRLNVERTSVLKAKEGGRYFS